MKFEIYSIRIEFNLTKECETHVICIPINDSDTDRLQVEKDFKAEINEIVKDRPYKIKSYISWSIEIKD